LVGTVRPNRQDFADLATANIVHEELIRALLAVKYRAAQDKANKKPKIVYMLTIAHANEIAASSKKDKDGNAVMKPTCVFEYNKSMGGVDPMDQQLDSLLVIWKSYKWYKKGFLPSTPAMYAERAEADATHRNETRLPEIRSRFSNAAADLCATPQSQRMRDGQCCTSDKLEPLSVQAWIRRYHGYQIAHPSPKSAV